VRKTLAVLLILAAILASTGAAAGRRVTVTLDWTPNPDHVGLYYARDTGLFERAGLDVAIHAPSDPTAPLKLVAVGKTDLAVSYEPELFLAAAKKLPVTAVAAVVPRPLNSLIAISSKVHAVRDLRGKSVGITGVPSDYATLDTALASAGLARKDVKVVNVGYNLLPALLSRKVDAVLGVYRNVEGIQLAQRGLHPTVIPVNRAGVPTYDELVLVASAKRLAGDPSYRTTVRTFVRAFLAGTSYARGNPKRAEDILAKVTASDRKFLDRATPATLALLAGPDGVGCLHVKQWARYGAWMRARGLLTKPVAASSVVDASFLPKRCSAGA
jgi:putative hydroxymethylpyrimidine transport system substrate-binding protein